MLVEQSGDDEVVVVVSKAEEPLIDEMHVYFPHLLSMT